MSGRCGRSRTLFFPNLSLFPQLFRTQFTSPSPFTIIVIVLINGPPFSFNPPPTLQKLQCFQRCSRSSRIRFLCILSRRGGMRRFGERLVVITHLGVGLVLGWVGGRVDVVMGGGRMGHRGRLKNIERMSKTRFTDIPVYCICKRDKRHPGNSVSHSSPHPYHHNRITTSS